MLPLLRRSLPVSLPTLALTGMAVLCPWLSASAQQAAETQTAAVSDTQLKTWHDNLKNYAPLDSGCYQTSYPSVQWTRVACGAKPAFVSAHPNPASTTTSSLTTHSTGAVAEARGGRQTTGNGNDYVAQTTNLTQSGLGSFPSVKNVTSEKGKGVAAFGGGGLLGANEYSLQLNTDINPSATACSAFGYASCYVWEQFVYSTAYSSYPAEVFIQNWVFPSQSDYNNRGCPSGWEDASSSGSPACYVNSAAANVANVSPKNLANVKLSGAVASGGKDTLIFTNGTTAYSASEADSTVHASAWWKQSEFNVVGNAGGSEAVFNKGASITVNLVVKDGTTNAPKCLSDSGTTGESNNLTLGSCTTASGTSPSITFTESD